MLVQTAAKAGVVTIVSVATGKIMKPVIRGIGSVTGLRQKDAAYEAAIETDRMRRETQNIKDRMDIVCDQRESLLKYGKAHAEMSSRYKELDEPSKKAIEEWERKFPEVS